MDNEPTKVYRASALEEPNQEHDDDDNEIFEEPFSLLENIVRERFRSPTSVEPFRSVEVIHYKGDQLSDVMRADPGHSIRVGLDRFPLIRVTHEERATLRFRSDFKGTVVHNSRARSLSKLCVDRFRCPRERDHYVATLRPGDYAQILRGNEGYLLRFVHAPTQPRSMTRWRPSWRQLQILLGSAALHLLVLALLGFTGSEVELPLPSREREFATPGSYQLPRLEQEQPRPEPAPPPAQPKTVALRPIKARSSTPPRARSSQPGRAQRHARKVLQALENLRPASGSPGRSDLGALSSNLAAIRTPAGQGFRIAGVIDRVGDGRVRLAGGPGGGGKETRTVGQLITGPGRRTGTLTAVEGIGHRGPRGMVKRVPPRDIVSVGMDRSLIQAVVNKHMHELQRCYEVQLLSQPNLEGKVVVDWTITRPGAVSEARLASSTLPSPAVAGCLLRKIRRWRFPAPGGSVKVRYPFVFRVRGF